jgi:hypothetical protein
MTRTGAGRPREVRGRGFNKIIYFDNDLVKEAEILCDEESVSFSDKTRQLWIQELERKNNTSSAIGVAYGDARQTNLLEFNDSIDIDELNKAANYLYWEEKGKEMSCQERLETGEVLGSMMSEAFKNRRHFLKTGIYRSRLGQQGQMVFRTKQMGWD